MKINQIRARLEDHEGESIADPEPRRAAVAVVLREVEPARGAEVLFIERALRKGDPWSGHMAFPGGRVEPEDVSLAAAAARETHEEVGIDLAQADYLGHLEDLMGTRRVAPQLVVSAHAFHLRAEQEFALDPAEVRNVIWFPLAELHASDRWVEHQIPELPGTAFPGIVVGEPDRHIVWGLTYRFLDRFFEVTGRPLPNRWGALDDRRDS